MTTQRYYNKYRKIKKNRIKDDSVLDRIENILKLPVVYGNTKEFLESIYEQYNRNGNLTERQLGAIEKIEKKHSEEKIKDYEEWCSSYSDTKREIAKMCAVYYKKNPPYFAELANKIFEDPGFIPSEKQYISMCDNQFTKKVIAATKSVPIFEVGMIVKGRKNAPIKVRDTYFSVMRVNASPVISAAKGAKIYEVLPFGKTHTILCEERYLKKVRKKA